MKAIHKGRHLVTFLALAGAFITSGCERATEEQCREAVRNMFRITAADDTKGAGPDEAAAVRSCQANSSKQTVECYIAAKNVADLKKCEGELAVTAEKKSTGEDEAREGAQTAADDK